MAICRKAQKWTEGPVPFRQNSCERVDAAFDDFRQQVALLTGTTYRAAEREVLFPAVIVR
jgi:hypothetical protein